MQDWIVKVALKLIGAVLVWIIARGFLSGDKVIEKDD